MRSDGQLATQPAQHEASEPKNSLDHQYWWSPAVGVPDGTAGNGTPRVSRCHNIACEPGISQSLCEAVRFRMPFVSPNELAQIACALACAIVIG